MLISRRILRAFLTALLALGLTGSALAATLYGTITNRTTGKASKGDTVAVINTSQGMDEIAKATSDANGKFKLDIPDGGQILLHITHAGADYFKSLRPGEVATDIDVYDASAKVEGITGQALVFRAETDPSGKMLSVSENFFVQNASAPARTQYGGKTLEFYIPAGAHIEASVASSGQEGLPTNAEVKPIDAAAGHYAFTFPLRPGDSRFQVVYTMPYSGQQDFSLKLGIPTNDFAVMLPKTVQFQSQGTTQFQSITPDVQAQSYDVHLPPVTAPVQFRISGTGQLPQSQTQTAQGGGSQQPEAAAGGQASSERPGGGMAPPGDPEGQNDPWSKYKWWILGILGLALASGAGLMLRRSSAAGAGDTAPYADVDGGTYEGEARRESWPAAATATRNPDRAPRGARPSLRPESTALQALKDELFELEAERVAGRITLQDYAEHKAALDLLLRRALSRIEGEPPASNE